MLFESLYKKIRDEAYEAGYNAKALENAEAQNDRLQEMLKYGKELGKKEGIAEGYALGYKVGYSEGETDARAEVGAISLDDLPEVQDFTGFKGLVNDRGFVDDISKALDDEAVVS